jgi:hypothetical protein
MEINSKPEELDVLDRKVMQLEIEIEAIKGKMTRPNSNHSTQTLPTSKKSATRSSHSGRVKNL